MNLRRSRAYGRVIRALDTPAALLVLTDDERQLLRDASDTLVLARGFDDDARTARADAHTVLLNVPVDELAPWLEQLAHDLEDAGPTPSPAGTWMRAVAGESSDRTGRRDDAT